MHCNENVIVPAWENTNMCTQIANYISFDIDFQIILNFPMYLKLSFTTILIHQTHRKYKRMCVLVTEISSIDRTEYDVTRLKYLTNKIMTTFHSKKGLFNIRSIIAYFFATLSVKFSSFRTPKRIAE